MTFVLLLHADLMRNALGESEKLSWNLSSPFHSGLDLVRLSPLDVDEMKIPSTNSSEIDGGGHGAIHK